MHISSKFFPAVCVLALLGQHVSSFDSEDEIIFDTDEFFADVTEADAYLEEISFRDIDINDTFVSVANTANTQSELKNRTRNISELLVSGIYKRSYPITERNLLDLPSIALTMPSEAPTCATYAKLFYNHNDAVAFEDQKTSIDAVTQLGGQSLIQQLEELVRFASEDLPILARQQLTEEEIEALESIQTFDIPQTIPLFAGIQLQTRRAGIMFEHEVAHETWSLTLQMPWYYLEHNFFATPDLQRRIANTRLISEFSAGSTSDDDARTESFLEKHLVADRIGIGDTRLTWLYAFRQTPSMSLWGGLEATFPTAGSFTEGLIGGEFIDFPEQPFGIVRNIINTASEDSDAALEIGLNAALEVLDRVTRIFADRPLGQEHFGIAPFMHWYWDAAACEITAQARIEYLTPRTLTRFFLIPTSREELDNRNYTAPEKASENISFVEEKIINALLPTPIDAHVRPGISPQVTTTLGQTFDTWRWHIGFDFWYHQREQITVPDAIQKRTPLNIAAAERPSAYQTKFFGNISMDVATRNYLWHVGMALDGTFGYQNVGQDITFGLYAGTTW